MQIDHFNLRSFDLNLLIAFDAMMKDRSVTKAATRLRIQQPAMSHNLSTLRLLMGDELFVRIGNRMQPTAKALALSEQVSYLLAQTQTIILAHERFDPATSERVFRIGFSCEELLLLPELGLALEQAAPGLKVMAQRVLTDQIGKALDDAAIDLAVGCYPPQPTRYHHSLLFEQKLACCFNHQFMTLGEPLTLDAYLAGRHVFVSQDDDLNGCIGSMLTNAGHQLNIVMGVPEYLTALAAASAAPLVVTLPLQIAQRYAATFGLSTRRVPIDLALPPIHLIWSTRSASDPAVEWLRGQVVESAGDAKATVRAMEVAA